MTGTELLVTSAPGGSATFTYTVRANDALFDYEARNVAEAVDGTSTYTASASSTVRTPLRAGFASNTPVELGSEAVFTSTTTGSMPISYTWDLGDGTVVSSTARLTHTYAATGTYTVLLMATNQFETDVVSGTYEVLAPPELLQYALPLVIKPADAIITGRAANERRETRYHTRE
jgi:PKD repeat protein